MQLARLLLSLVVIRVLCSWGLSRHINYLGEILQALALALPGYLTAGSLVPFLYPLYYVALMLPRQIEVGLCAYRTFLDSIGIDFMNSCIVAITGRPAVQGQVRGGLGRICQGRAVPHHTVRLLTPADPHTVMNAHTPTSSYLSMNQGGQPGFHRHFPGASVAVHERRRPMLHALIAALVLAGTHRWCST